MSLSLYLACWGTEEGVIGPARVSFPFSFACLSVSSHQPSLFFPALVLIIPLPYLFLIKILNPISFHTDHATTVIFANSFFAPSASLFLLLPLLSLLRSLFRSRTAPRFRAVQCLAKCCSSSAWPQQTIATSRASQHYKAHELHSAD